MEECGALIGGVDGDRAEDKGGTRAQQQSALSEAGASGAHRRARVRSAGEGTEAKEERGASH